MKSGSLTSASRAPAGSRLSSSRAIVRSVPKWGFRRFPFFWRNGGSLPTRQAAPTTIGRAYGAQSFWPSTPREAALQLCWEGLKAVGEGDDGRARGFATERDKKQEARAALAEEGDERLLAAVDHVALPVTEFGQFVEVALQGALADAELSGEIGGGAGCPRSPRAARARGQP